MLCVPPRSPQRDSPGSSPIPHSLCVVVDSDGTSICSAWVRTPHSVWMSVEYRRGARRAFTTRSAQAVNSWSLWSAGAEGRKPHAGGCFRGPCNRRAGSAARGSGRPEPPTGCGSRARGEQCDRAARYPQSSTGCARLWKPLGCGLIRPGRSGAGGGAGRPVDQRFAAAQAPAVILSERLGSMPIDLPRVATAASKQAATSLTGFRMLSGTSVRKSQTRRVRGADEKPVLPEPISSSRHLTCSLETYSKVAGSSLFSAAEP